MQIGKSDEKDSKRYILKRVVKRLKIDEEDRNDFLRKRCFQEMF